MGFNIADVLGGSLADSVKGIISEFKLDPTKKAELQAAVEANASLLAQKQLELQDHLNDVAGQNIRSETSSSYAFTRNARPAFLWIMTGGIGLNITIPLIARIFHYDVPPVDLSAYMDLFKLGFLGYVGARTVEKLKDAD